MDGQYMLVTQFDYIEGWWGPGNGRNMTPPGEDWEPASFTFGRHLSRSVRPDYPDKLLYIERGELSRKGGP